MSSDSLEWTNPGDFVADVRRFAMLSGRAMEDELINQVRLGFVKVIKITPPGSSLKGGASAAKKAGAATISADMNRVMAPVRLKGSRQITTLFGKPAELFGGPWTVKTKEAIPNVEAYYRPHFKNGRRPRGRSKVAVSKRKFDRLRRKRQKRSGWLAGGFGPSAIGVGASLPAYAKRHLHAVPSPRRQTIERLGDRGIVITLENNVKYASRLDLQKRLNWAMKVQQNSMERQIPYLQRRVAQDTGFS